MAAVTSQEYKERNFGLLRTNPDLGTATDSKGERPEIECLIYETDVIRKHLSEKQQRLCPMYQYSGWWWKAFVSWQFTCWLLKMAESIPNLTELGDNKYSNR